MTEEVASSTSREKYALKSSRGKKILLAIFLPVIYYNFFIQSEHHLFSVKTETYFSLHLDTGYSEVLCFLQ